MAPFFSIPFFFSLALREEAADRLAGLPVADVDDAVARVQLGTRMPDPERQRLVRVDERRAMLAFRTWRFLFETAETPRVLAIASGYTAGELRPEAPDPYGDKALHRLYQKSGFPKPS